MGRKAGGASSLMTPRKARQAPLRPSSSLGPASTVVGAWRAQPARRAHNAANLRGWLNKPYQTDKVIAVLKRAEYPLLMRDVAEASSLPVSIANRILLRLHQRGWVRRWKLPIKRHAYCRKTRAVVPYGATRQLYVYSWVGR